MSPRCFRSLATTDNKWGHFFVTFEWNWKVCSPVQSSSFVSYFVSCADYLIDTGECDPTRWKENDTLATISSILCSLRATYPSSARVASKVNLLVSFSKNRSNLSQILSFMGWWRKLVNQLCIYQSYKDVIFRQEGKFPKSFGSSFISFFLMIYHEVGCSTKKTFPIKSWSFIIHIPGFWGFIISFPSQCVAQLILKSQTQLEWFICAKGEFFIYNDIPTI